MLRILSVVLVCLASAGPLAAGEAPLGSPDFYPSAERPIGWRGDGTGAYPGATPVPVFGDGPPVRVEAQVRDTWGDPKQKRVIDVGDGPSRNIVWKYRPPAWAHSQPLIVGDRVITVAEPHSLICVDMNSGEELWSASNSPFELMGLPTEQVAALEDYLARAYAARVPLAARTGNYRRLPAHSPSEWRAEFLAPVLDECALAEQALKGLIAENPYGEKAEPALAALHEVVAKIKALKPGDKSKDLGKPLVGAAYQAVHWIEEEHKVPCLYGWDGYIGWTFATPCSDGERVYASMGQGQVVCYDLEGRRIWGRRIPNYGKNGEPLSRGRPRVRAKHVPSPCLAGDAFIAQAPDRLVALDKHNGRTLWDAGISVGGGYKVASHLPLRLDSGRWILVTTTGRVLDALTGKQVADTGLPCYGSEGAGASIVGRDRTAFIVGSPGKRKSCLAAFRFGEEGDRVTCEKLWQVDSGPSGQTPVLFGDHLYRFSARRREDRDVYAVADGSAVARLGARTGGTSPILAGRYFFTYHDPGRDRVDQRLILPVSVVELAGPTEQGKVYAENHLDLSAPPPDWRVEKHLPEIYARIEENAPLPEWAKKKWSTPWWGKDGGIPSGSGVGGFCASGNRVVLRTIGTLYCLGDPDVEYDWNPASRE